MNQDTANSNSPVAYDQNPPKAKPGCFSFRNIALGCVGCMLLCGGFGALTIFGAMGMIKTSGAYTQAVAIAKANPEVQKKIGSPMSEGLFTSGNINTENNTGNADLLIPISGPTGSGNVHLVATMKDGNWTYSVLEADVGGEHINLLSDSAPLPKKGN